MSIITVVNQLGKTYKINDVKEIARGGEGAIYELGSDKVAKIYHPGIDPINQIKFDFLKKLDKNLFIAPQELLFNNKSKVVGFTMDFLSSDFYPLSSLFTKSFCAANGVDKKIKLYIIEQLIKALEYAHKMNVVIGDLNCLNIMVNNKGDIKLIDTDSYQTPGYIHSGRLLDEIRDYYYQGRINDKSDCFALSILIFNLLAFTHPFKGIHKKYMKISDRMIHKIPVFITDPDLKLPKCYEPINDNNLLNQFQRFYLQGERFVMSLSDINANMIVLSLNQPANIKQYEQDNLIITYIAGDETVKSVFCTEMKMVIETDTGFLIYNTKNKGYVSLIDSISKKDYDQVFIGNTNIVLRKDRKLFIYKGVDNAIEVTSFVLPEKYIIKQYEDILMIIDYDNMYKLFLDETIAGVIKMKTVSVFGKGFKSYQSLVYNSGGKQNIFYNESGHEISIVSLPIKIEDLYQDRNVGIMQYVEKKEIKYKFFKIKNLKMQISQFEIPQWTSFAFRADNTGEGFIFMPVDDAIKILRTQDFAEISEMKCDLATSESVIKNTTSGLILFETGKVWLLNKK